MASIRFAMPNAAIAAVPGGLETGYPPPPVVSDNGAVCFVSGAAMDGYLAIEHNHAALKRIFAALIAMAGLAGEAPVIRRRLRSAVLRLLRPAEAAARRLIIAMARGLAAPESRPYKPHGSALKGGRDGNIEHKLLRPLSFPLLDPLKNPLRRRFFRAPRSAGVPRICFPGFTEPFPVEAPKNPGPDDMLDASRLARRLAALGRALDDMPAQARRFVLWRARHKRRLDSGSFRRLSALRSGRPPGSRPRNASRRAAHEVHDVLAHAHSLALYALERRDTS